MALKLGSTAINKLYLGSTAINKTYLGTGVVFSSAFDPASLFAGGTEGAWFDPSDIDTLFQVSDGTTPVTVATDPIGYFGDKSGNGNHAAQATAARRLTYQTSPARATLDKVDDRLSVTVPAGGFVGTMVLGTDQGTASYGVNIPAGDYNLGGEYFPGNAINGVVFLNSAMTNIEKSNTEEYFIENGAGVDYSEVTSFSDYWRDRSEITEFPLIDTSSGTNFSYAWRNCTSLTSFPLIDTSSATDLLNSWFSCTSLTSFPLIDTSSVTRFFNAWRNCSSLTSFPLIDTSSGTNFEKCWQDCSSLISFPSDVFDNVKGSNFIGTFDNTNLNEASIDGILVSLVASGIATGTRVFDQSGGSAPSSTGEAAIDTLRSRGWTVTVTGGY